MKKIDLVLLDDLKISFGITESVEINEIYKE